MFSYVCANSFTDVWIELQRCFRSSLSSIISWERRNEACAERIQAEIRQFGDIALTACVGVCMRVGVCLVRIQAEIRQFGDIVWHVHACGCLLGAYCSLEPAPDVPLSVSG